MKISVSSALFLFLFSLQALAVECDDIPKGEKQFGQTKGSFVTGPNPNGHEGADEREVSRFESYVERNSCEEVKAMGDFLMYWCPKKCADHQVAD